MKVDIRLPQQGVEANITCYGPTGNKIQVSRIVIEPIFHDSRQRVPIVYGTTSMDVPATEEDDEGEEEIQRFMLTLSGANGRTVLLDRSKRVTPVFETRRKKERKAVEAETPRSATPEFPDEDDIALPQEIEE